jgi:hypothetical protein
VLETADEPAPRHNLIWFFVQLISSVPGVMRASLPFWAVLSMLGWGSDHQPGRFAGFDALACLFVGVLAGWAVAHAMPAFVSSGRWLWLPAIVLLPAILREQFQKIDGPWLNGYLFASSELGIGVSLFTFPLCAIAGYSAGMALAGKPGVWAKVDRRFSAIRVLGLSLAAVGFFAFSALALEHYEQRSLARWARIRTVIDKDGLHLVQEARFLCGSQPSLSVRSRILPWGTYVETLERRACSGGQIVGMDTLPSPIPGAGGPFHVDRVRVLNAPGDIEGWVLDYGLLQPHP